MSLMLASISTGYQFYLKSLHLSRENSFRIYTVFSSMSSYPFQNFCLNSWRIQSAKFFDFPPMLNFCNKCLSNISREWLSILPISAQWVIAVSGCFNFYPRSTNSTSYESWHLQKKFETSVRSLNLIVWPQDISEVTEVKMKILKS